MLQGCGVAITGKGRDTGRITGAGQQPGLSAPSQIGGFPGQSRTRIQRIITFQPRHQGFAKRLPGAGVAHNLIEARVGLTSALPVQQQVDQDTIGCIVIDQTLAGLGQLEHAACNDRARNVQHSGRELSRGVDAQGLSEHAAGGTQQLRR